MNNIQTVIRLDDCRDLRGLIAAMSDARAEGSDSVVLWGQGQESRLLKEIEQLELVKLYANRLDIKIVLSAANNPRLRRTANQIGWKVLWEMPEMDAILQGTAIEREANRWVVFDEADKDDMKIAGD